MITLEQVKKDVTDVIERGWIYYNKGDLTYETIIEKQFPHIDIGLLCDLYDDHRGYQDEIIKGYVEIAKKRDPELYAEKGD